jgi:archaellum component FlaF (FlaF/FlaG flagellin family)
MAIMFSADPRRAIGVGLPAVVVALLASAALAASAQADPTAELNPVSAAFPDTLIGQTSLSEQLKLTNDGPDPILVGGASIGGSDASSFTIASDDCATKILEGGDSCSVDVAFTPTARGPLNAELDVSHSSDGPSTAPLSGNGLLKELTVSPSQLNFPATTVNTNADQMQVTVKNSGDVQASINNVFVGGDPGEFNNNGNCGGSLYPGQGCTINVGFQPNSAGDKNATLTVQSDDPRGDQNVDLTGTGAEPQLSFEPASYDFGLQYVNSGSTQTTFQVRNTGPAPVQVNGFDVIGSGSNAFWIGFSDCFGGGMLQPNATCSVQVNFGPNDTVPYSAQLREMTNGVSFTADLSGEGGRSALVGSPNPADFGSAPTGSLGSTRTITFTNTGSLPGAFFISVISSGDVASFRLLSENCAGHQIDPGGTCTAQVRFQPTDAGPLAAELSYFGDSDGGTQVTLTGTGVAPQASLDPASHDFGVQTTNSTGPARVFSLTNNGSVPLDVSGASISGTGADQFRLSADECADNTLAPGQSCAIQVRFGPDRIGPQLARLRVATDGGALTAALTGTGVAPARLTFHWRGRGPLKAKGSDILAGDAVCHGASDCHLSATARFVADAGSKVARKSSAVELSSARLTIHGGHRTPVRLRLTADAKRALAAGGGRLVLRLRWSVDGRGQPAEISRSRRLES